MAANGAQYGLSTVHFYWIGAVPAMVFLGLVMMPFYYGSRVRTVPEYLLRRFNKPTHLLNAGTFALAAVLNAGVNLFALGLVINALIGWPIWVSVIASALFVLVYITLGGLSGAIYNEVLQFFVILAGLIPLVIIGLHSVGGWSGLQHRVATTALGSHSFSTFGGTGVGHWSNPLGDWIGIVMGLGFVLSFGYWTTNFAEVQRALSAKDLSAGQRTPLIGAFPKIFIPALTIIPGLIVLVLIPTLGGKNLPYNDAIPLLMGKFLPNGTLGVALAGLLAAFMAGMAANISSFNTVFTYDIWQGYIVKGRPDGYYLRVGRIVTVVGILIGIGTAFIASGYSNIMTTSSCCSRTSTPRCSPPSSSRCSGSARRRGPASSASSRAPWARQPCTSPATTSATSIRIRCWGATGRSMRRWSTSTARWSRSSPSPTP